MLNNNAKGGSAVLELLIGAIIVTAVGVGVYHIQHPQVTPQQQISQAIQE